MRYERKYRIPGDGFESIRAIVETHPAAFTKQFPDRQVNNIYLDSPDLTCFRDNLIGAMNREKFRIRWYGERGRQIETPRLELKRKDGELGDKFSQELKPLLLDNIRDLQREINDQFRTLGQHVPVQPLNLPEQAIPLKAKDLLPEVHPLKAQLQKEGIDPPPGLSPAMLAARLRLPTLRPTLLNSYQRSYYISRNHRFRLTIDRQMEFQGMDRHRPFTGAMITDPAIVIEVKYDFNHDEDYDQIGQFLPFRAGKNSKYVMGMLLVGQV